MDSPVPLDILVIEDDAHARDNLRDILELDDHRVSTAGSAAEALKRRDWAAVCRDYPGSTASRRDGRAAHAPAQGRWRPDAAVIVVTGYSDIQGAIAALRQGATDYILKPLNVDLLRTSLRRIAERRQLALAKERSEAAFRHLVEAADCMIVILRPDHQIVYFSPFAEQLSGYSDRGGPRPKLPRAAGAGARSTRCLRGIPAGDRRQPDPRIPEPDRLPRRHHGGGWRGTRGISRTTKMGRRFCRSGWTSRSCERRRSGRSKSERLAAIGQMVTGLAHESRNALQRSQACLEMLALAVRDRPKALDLIKRLQDAQDHLHTLYEDVRSYAAPINLDKEAMRLAAGLAGSVGTPGARGSRKEGSSARAERRRRPAMHGRPISNRAGLPQHARQCTGRRYGSRR